MKSFYHGDLNEYIQWYDTDGNIINASDNVMFMIKRVMNTK